MQMMDHALDYANRGLWVIPLHTPRNGGCSCGKKNCGSVGKHPRTKNGLKDATVDEKQIREWWNRWPNANIGILTGRESGIVVLDVDSEAGEKALKGRHLPPTPVASTGRGLHRYFAYPNNGKRIKSAKVFEACDIKADGGYVVAPPSLHPSGRQYEWQDTLSLSDIDLADCPQWLIELTSGKTDRTDEPAAEKTVFYEGERNNRLASLAGSLRRQGLKENEIADQLLALNRKVCVPPLSEDEVRRIARSIGTYPPGPAADFQSEESKKISTDVIANALTLEYYFAKGEGGKLYVYKDGRYCDCGREFVKTKVKELLCEWNKSDKWSSYRVREVEEYIAADCPKLLSRPPEGKVNVRNGIIDVRSRVLEPHTPDFLSPIQLPIIYDPDAKPEALEAFFREVFPADCCDTLPWQILGLLMVPYTGLQKAILLLGDRAAGKSTFLEVVKAFLVRENCSACSLQSLEENRFAAANLVGKLANICADLPNRHLEDTSVFKSITGEDVIQAERKMQPSFSFKPFARLIFSANRVPRSSDTTQAFLDRWIVVPFERSFRDNPKPRGELVARLTTPQELSGALNKALEFLPGVLAHGIPETESLRKGGKIFREEVDSVASWIYENCVFGSSLYVPKDDLLQRLNEARRDQDMPEISAKALTQRIKQAFPQLTQTKRPVGSARVPVWLGIGLKSDLED